MVEPRSLALLVSIPESIPALIEREAEVKGLLIS